MPAPFLAALMLLAASSAAAQNHGAHVVGDGYSYSPDEVDDYGLPLPKDDREDTGTDDTDITMTSSAKTTSTAAKATATSSSSSSPSASSSSTSSASSSTVAETATAAKTGETKNTATTTSAATSSTSSAPATATTTSTTSSSSSAGSSTISAATGAPSTTALTGGRLSLSASGTLDACDTMGLTIAGGQAPFIVAVFNGNTSISSWNPIETLDQSSTATHMNWTINYPAGRQLRLGVQDEKGVMAFTDAWRVGKSGNDQCLSASDKDKAGAAAAGAKSSKLSTGATAAIVIAALLGVILLVIGIMAWLRRRRNRQRQLDTVICFDPQPNARFEIESDMGDSADYHNLDPDPISMAEMSHDPLTYGMPYPPGNPFMDAGIAGIGRGGGYAVASSMAGTGYPAPGGGMYDHAPAATGGVAVAATREAPLPPLPTSVSSMELDNVPLSPESAKPGSVHAAGAYEYMPRPASSNLMVGFPTPVRSASVRSDTSFTTHRSSQVSTGSGLYDAGERFHHRTSHVPDVPQIPEEYPALAHNAEWRTRNSRYESNPYGGAAFP